MSAPLRHWRWLDTRLMHAVHEAQLAGHGGGSGLRDTHMLELAAGNVPEAAFAAWIRDPIQPR